MENMGYSRRVDELGRVVLPIEIRRRLGIEERDALDISLDKDRIIMKKWQQACVFCGSEISVDTYKEKQVCKSCAGELKKLT